MHALLAASALPFTPEAVFSMASNAALPGWILLAILPHWKGTQWIVHAGILPAILGGAYVVILGSAIATTGLNFAEFGSLEGIKRLFQQDWVLVGGWIHYLVFDLWTGAWIVRDARRMGFYHLAVIPSLFLTLMLGPTGLVSYLLMRWSICRKFEVE